MGKDTARIATRGKPPAVWKLLEEVAGWTGWNAGIERIKMAGPCASGSTLAMQPPCVAAITSRLSDARPDAGVTDETVLGDTRFLVSHELRPLPTGGTRIAYAIRVEGPDAETLGPVVTADFAEVLAALKALAER